MLRRVLALVGSSLIVLAGGLACKKESPPPPPTAAPSPLVECDAGKVDPETDLANCGFCDNACKAAHGTTSCVKGKCAPVCEPGWESCGYDHAACSSFVKTDPRACGRCGARCLGVPCVDGACAPSPPILTADAWGYGITSTDGVYLFLGPPNATSSWTRVRVADGVVERRDDKTQFVPMAFDGKYLYGCKSDPGGGNVCELRRREGDGPETKVGSLANLMYRTMAVKDGTVYWARAIPDSLEDGQGPFADIVATELASKAERVLATGQAAPVKMIVDDQAVYWVGSGVKGSRAFGLRKIARGGGAVVGLAEIPVASSLAQLGDSIFVTGYDGLMRVPKAGGDLVPILFGVPKNVTSSGTQSVIGVEVVGDDVFWAVQGKDVLYETVLHSKLAR